MEARLRRAQRAGMRMDPPAVAPPAPQGQDGDVKRVAVTLVLLTLLGLVAGLALAFGSPTADTFFTPRILVAGVGVGVIALVLFVLLLRRR